MAFRTQKISQMTPKGADLEATDLIEVSTIESGSYVTRSITGQELIDAIPLPPTGLTVGTTPIASGTNGRFLFDDAGVVSETNGAFWDKVNGRFGLGTSSPATGTSLDVNGRIKANIISADAVNNTLNTVTLLQFSATGNRLFDNSGTQVVNVRGGNIQIGTTTDAGFRLDVNGTARATKVVVGASTASPYQLNVWGGAVESYISLNNTNSGNLNTDGFQIGLEPNGTDVYFINRENGFIQFRTNNLDRFRIFSTGNVGINTTTDAGFRLDVNGTARIKGSGTTILDLQNSAGSTSAIFYDDLSAYINGKNSGGFTTNIRIGGLSNQANMNFFGNNNIYVGQGGSTENIPTALIAMGSTTKGFLPPRMTTTQKNAIATPATGLQIFDTTLNRPCFYDGTTWITL